METALITGANRGLGLEFARQFAGSGHRVIATCRNPQAATELRALAESAGNVEIHALDTSRKQDIFSLAARLQCSIDHLVANAAISPNKMAALAEIDEKEWLDVFRTNTLGPAYLAAAFAPAVTASERRVMAFVSTRMTVLNENVAGGYYMYRSSKGALNQVIRNLSIELGPKGVAVMALHPGFVRTDMGGARGAIDAEESVSGLMKVLLAAGPADNGCFRDWTGQDIGW